MDSLTLKTLALPPEDDHADPPQPERTDAPPEAAPLPFDDRFASMPITPREIADAVVEDDGVFRALSLEDVEYSPTPRFMKGLALRMRVPIRVFDLFSPLEVIRRAAEVAPDMALRVTVDEEKKQALALVEDKGLPIPAGAVRRIMLADSRLKSFDYSDGIIKGMFDLGETWDIPKDSMYRVQVQTTVPVDGLGTPEATLGVTRLACTNGAIAEASQFRTKMEVKDNSGAHFQRLLQSFGNPQGVEALHERLLVAVGTKASVGEVHTIDEFLRRQVRDAKESMLLRERLQDVAGNPCVRYGVTDIGAIGLKRRSLLPADCSVADLLNFVTELASHHAAVLKAPESANDLIGGFYTSGFDLEEMYPNTREASPFMLQDMQLHERVDA